MPPFDCEFELWAPWGECSVTCGGGGSQSRTRGIASPAENGGAECEGDFSEERGCVGLPCPVDCVVAWWNPWGDCSATCGGGSQWRTRSILVDPVSGGAECEALIEEEACSELPCPVDCEVSEWSPWGDCSATCGEGVQSRTRGVDVPAAHGGAECQGDLSEER